MTRIRSERKLFNQALALWHEGKTDEAVSILQGFVKRYPKEAAPYGVIGGIYYELERYEEAVGFLNKTLEINPRSELASGLLVHSLLALGRKDEARVELRRFIDLTGSREFSGILREIEEEE